MDTQSIIEGLIDHNIFGFKKGDGIAYLALYVIIPVAITVINLSMFPLSDLAGVYFYVTILVSALNCIYDAWNRWIPGKRVLKNTKLFLMMLFTGIVAAYCLVVILYTLITQNGLYRHDWILLGYIVVIIISAVDSFNCFSVEMAWDGCVKRAVPKEGGK